MKGSLQIKSGKYYAVFRVNGKVKWFNLKIEAARGNKRKAEQAMAELIIKYNESPNLFDKTNFIEYIKKWLKEVENQVDTITYEGYKQYTEKHIIPYFQEKGLYLQNVKISDIEGYYNYKSTAGRLDGKKGGLSLRTIKLHSVPLSLVFKKAIHEGILKENPCEYAKFPKIEKTQPIAKFYTVEQCKTLLSTIHNTPLYAMVYITTLYGLRRSELLGLKWDAIDFTNKTLTINHTVVLNNSIVKKDKTKNNASMRIYPLLEDVEKILINIKKQQKEYEMLFGNCYNKSSYIFTKEDGSTYYPSYPSHMLQKYLKRYNLPHIRWHDLRHTAASMLILKGWQMKEISNWLGHSDISITANLYTHIDIAHKRELGNTLNGMFNN